VCTNHQTAEYLINRARTLIYSTALPPPSAAAALAALRQLRDDPATLQRLWRNARLLRTSLAAHGFAIEPGDMPIIPIHVGQPQAAMKLCEIALARGVFAQAIRPPTVPVGTSRIRAVVTAAHKPDHLHRAAGVLATARSHAR
jgi:glycine C-acetyltransferase/8-amino-7-oxononanoate synthase